MLFVSPLFATTFVTMNSYASTVVDRIDDTSCLWSDSRPAARARPLAKLVSKLAPMGDDGPSDRTASRPIVPLLPDTYVVFLHRPVRPAPLGTTLPPFYAPTLACSSGPLCMSVSTVLSSSPSRRAENHHPSPRFSLHSLAPCFSFIAHPARIRSSGQHTCLLAVRLIAAERCVIIVSGEG